ncbi:MAG: hypothetical protein V1688_03995 [bacterium]
MGKFETIGEDTNEGELKQALKNEFAQFFKDLKERGLEINLELLNDPKYHTLRNNSQALKKAEENISKLEGGADNTQTFIDTEEEALEEFLNSEAQQEK